MGRYGLHRDMDHGGVERADGVGPTRDWRDRDRAAGDRTPVAAHGTDDGDGTPRAGRHAPPRRGRAPGPAGSDGPSRRAVLRAGVVAGLASLAGCASMLRGDREERLIEQYGVGLEAYNAGVDQYNDGVVAYRSDDYEETMRVIGESTGTLEDALEAFRTARRLAAETGNGRAADLCGTAVARCEAVLRTADLLAATAEGFANENYERAQAKYDQYREQAAQLEVTVPSQERVADAVDDNVLPF